MKLNEFIKEVRCSRCNELLNPNKAIWFELSETDGNYYNPENFPINHKSQGGFSFGKDCAKKVNDKND